MLVIPAGATKAISVNDLSKKKCIPCLKAFQWFTAALYTFGDWQLQCVSTVSHEIKLATSHPLQGIGKIIALFDKAAAHLKFPTVVLQDATIGEFKMYRAGSQSQYPGCVQVKSNGTWFGRILPDGKFSFKDDTPSTLVTLIEEFGNNPAQVAAAHGKLHGKCCFCNSALTDEKSTAVGYGPVRGLTDTSRMLPV